MGDDEIRSSGSESPNWGTRRKRDIDELLHEQLAELPKYEIEIDRDGRAEEEAWGWEGASGERREKRRRREGEE
jgi:hypothetical protein